MGIMAKETESFVVDVEGVLVHVVRKRVKNINLRIGSDGTARMSVPWHMPKAEVYDVARRHAAWLRSSMAKVELRQAVSSVSWKTGARLRVWGNEVTLLVTEEDGEPMCALCGDVLELRGAERLSADAREVLVERWLAGQLKEKVDQLLPECERLVGVQATSITLRRMKTRWGSCTSRTGRIRLNTALAECPPNCTRMVLIHELCHIREANHGPRFHALMDLHCPDWRATQRWLNEHPPRV